MLAKHIECVGKFGKMVKKVEFCFAPFSKESDLIRSQFFIFDTIVEISTI